MAVGVPSTVPPPSFWHHHQLQTFPATVVILFYQPNWAIAYPAQLGSAGSSLDISSGCAIPSHALAFKNQILHHGMTSRRRRHPHASPSASPACCVPSPPRLLCNSHLRQVSTHTSKSRVTNKPNLTRSLLHSDVPTVGVLQCSVYRLYSFQVPVCWLWTPGGLFAMLLWSWLADNT